MKIQVDDASEKGHCIRVWFAEPHSTWDELSGVSYDEWQNSLLYRRMEQVYEIEACTEVFGALRPRDLEFDWRDEQEVWLRYNIGESVPVVPQAPLDEIRMLIVLSDLQEFAQMEPKDVAEILVDGYPRLEDHELENAMCERFIEYSVDEGYVIFLRPLEVNVVFEPWKGTDAIAFMWRHWKYLV